MKNLIPINIKARHPQKSHNFSNFFAPMIKYYEKKCRRLISKPLRLKLLDLGLTEQALEELNHYASGTAGRALQRDASWQLALWYSNRPGLPDPQRGLLHLSAAANGETCRNKLARIAILAAEFYQAIGEIDAAKNVIRQLKDMPRNPDLSLALANLEPHTQGRLNFINCALRDNKLPAVNLLRRPDYSPFDNLNSPDSPITANVNTSRKVSIIIPAYNAAKTIGHALNSLTTQTWRNIEILVADDCSTDATRDIVGHQMQYDNRIRLLQTEINQGPYVARNRAIQIATGEFVTCSDADDWSHPQKIERQVRKLLDNNKALANLSSWVRMTENLEIKRQGNPGYFIEENISSLMIPRITMLEHFGAWDSVRFGADTELWDRIQKIFGRDKIEILPDLVSFGRISKNSLTENSFFGYSGFLKGARKEYRDTYLYYHSSRSNLHYDFAQEARPFPVPEPLEKIKPPIETRGRSFDYIYVSDFRLDSNARIVMKNIIRNGFSKNLSIGFVQINKYELRARKVISKFFREFMFKHNFCFIVYGEMAICRNLIVVDPAIFKSRNVYVPNIRFGSAEFCQKNKILKRCKTKNIANLSDIIRLNFSQNFSVFYNYEDV